MAPTPSPKKSQSKPKSKREKLFHPESRKAGQLARTQLRKIKLSEAASKRHKQFANKTDVFNFFYHAMPPDREVLTLEELHEIIQDLWLTRHDVELEAEKVARRKGRPKSVNQMKLEEIKLRESEEYRTGMEVIDLTYLPNVKLFRAWDQKEFAYIQMLRFIRISSSNPTVSVISNPGQHHTLHIEDTQHLPPDQEMDVADIPKPKNDS